ncbi:MAG: 3-oxoacyl-[acyl-carrier-protein] reductase [Candidatus Marinimicrobia bacterium]|jgi:3-oxoacyl-[acyl-carrier protein] reductase|nr:3-oxoacyl-[acyl-carrier-protein] reductase [Candidatus Neomarinimicrobiota bacterium]MDP6456197.1 3-oxoacyl-[acyl-carrier-protein] reductase [Candidatus Neomarinimicrobiota bacterium]MDP6593706.1 3-oxoacyl-[acyl-carrier-protein] reductase [Candidatus Neomarinimicrobiota bacterium]MDP6836383.1 3-oxoacyl-[acyl-carrier-protein] reductase [Candidatus Neomarinimicrobiota bacterium]MDP6966052.1 3-oxoacyl-[acyl-carrier-protein] reductase [Candidatus Neomarinimicrobiota bacterium]|tara:strand:+ start:5486 stop:6229 length:744 start_codon:yes stop_codon:yes gene_type:complete
MPENDSRVAFVTGASRGIGKAVAYLFGNQDVKVVCASRTAADLDKVVNEITDAGGEALATPLDTSDASAFSTAVKQAVEHFGAIHILVNNAGITRDKLILRMSETDWDSVLDVNLKGYFNGIKAVTPFMMKNRFGRIINITSLVGIAGNAGQSNYAASKAGAIGLTKSAAKELASRNITVNAIAPGYIETDMTEQLSEDVKNELINQIPLQRIGSPDDVAQLVSFIASDEAGYITGQTISVNGGLYM